MRGFDGGLKMRDKVPKKIRRIAETFDIDSAKKILPTLSFDELTVELHRLCSSLSCERQLDSGKWLQDNGHAQVRSKLF
jgi:hypothetical protein